MSEMLPFSISENDKTILVPRSNGDITPMRLSETADGAFYAYSSSGIGDERDVDAYKTIQPGALSTENQDALAEELAMSRPDITAQQLERGEPNLAEAVELHAELVAEVAEDLGKEAVEDSGIFSPDDEVNENAQRFTKQQLQEIRTQLVARGIVNDAGEVIPQLDEMMAGDPAASREPTIKNLDEMMGSAETAPLSVQEQLNALTEGLSDNDLMELRSYASNSEDKKDIHRRIQAGEIVGAGESAQQAQQRMGQSYNAMSARAKNIAAQYAHLYTYL